MITSDLTVMVVLAGLVFGALVLERRHRVFAALGAALLAVAAAMLLSNVGVLPPESAVYRVLNGTGIDLGIVLILMRVDLRTVAKVDRPMVTAFGLAILGTVVGAMVGGVLLADLVGVETWKLAGQYAGTYSGGGVNFAAVGRAVDTSAALFTSALGADVIVTTVWLLVCLAAPLLLPSPVSPAGRHAAPAAAAGAAHSGTSADDAHTLDRALIETGRPLDLMGTAALVALAFGVLWLSGVLGGLVPRLPSVFWLTTVALVLAQVPYVRGLPGGAMVGNYLVILFLVANGAVSVLAIIIETGPAVFYYAMMTVAFHGAVVLGVGRALGIDIPTLVVASQAAVGGPPTAVALASARGYGDRLVPGVVVGLVGYAGGNYLGLAVAAVMKGLLGA